MWSKIINQASFRLLIITVAFFIISWPVATASQLNLTMMMLSISMLWGVIILLLFFMDR